MKEPRVKKFKEDLMSEAYYEVCGHLNRVERRTTKGRLIEMKAKLAALEVELQYYRDKENGTLPEWVV